jgi:hypothetical protein
MEGCGVETFSGELTDGAWDFSVLAGKPAANNAHNASLKLGNAP